MPASRQTQEAAQRDPLGAVRKTLLNIAGQAFLWLAVAGIPATASFALHIWSVYGELASTVAHELRPIQGKSLNDTLRDVLNDHKHCGKKFHHLEEEFHIHQSDYNKSLASLSAMIASVSEKASEKVGESTNTTRRQITALGESIIILRGTIERLESDMRRLERS